MKLGFSTLGCPKWNIDEIVAFANECDYSGVEIRFVSGEVNLWKLQDFMPDHLARTREKFVKHGLEVVSIDTSVRFVSDDPAEQEKHLDMVRINARIASGLGARYIRVFGGPIPKGKSRVETLECMTAGLTKAVKAAEPFGVTVLLETHDDFSTGAQVKDLLQEVKGLHILWDILHSYRHGESFEETYKLIGDRIKHVHIKDASTFTPQGFDYKLIGQGRLPVSEAVQVLRSHEYDGFLNFEWEKGWHPEIEEPEVALPHYITAMKSILK